LISHFFPHVKKKMGQRLDGEGSIAERRGKAIIRFNILLTREIGTRIFYLHLLEIDYHILTITMNQSLAHGLEILLLFDSTHPAFTVPEMVARLHFSQSKTYRLIRALVHYGLLETQNGNGQYSLGMSALRLGLLAQQKFSVSAMALPFMRELSRLTKETVLLTAVSGNKAICLERVESEEPIRYSLFIPGASLPLHAGASSKVLLAFLPERERATILVREGLQRFTPQTTTDGAVLKAQLKEIRNQGYSFSDQEVDREVRAVAAPILNKRGGLIAGLTVAGPAYRINKKRVQPLGRLVMRFAGRIASQIQEPALLPTDTQVRRPARRKSIFP
jgi:DNA-binding IclR family transcriptional regulator